MNTQLLGNIVIGLGLVAFLAYRQTTWRAVNTAQLWRGPIILGAIGVFVMTRTASSITALDVALLAVEAVLAIGTGIAMGALSRFRRRPGGEGTSVIEARTGAAGALLWVIMIAVRIGIDIGGGMLGAELIRGTGVILIMIAINRAARRVTIDRAVSHRAVAA